MHISTARAATVAAGILAGLVCTLAYHFGLPGGFVFDDYPNLEGLARFADGRLSASAVIFTNDSGAFGRAIPMATFVLNEVTTGMNAGPMKATNIGIHIVCGGLIALLLRQLLLRESELRSRATYYAIAISAIWMVLPINVSTTLYIIQRMTQISALFVLLGLLSFVHSRQSWLTHPRSSRCWLWLGVPGFTVLALLSKENGALLPLLALALECTLFGDNRPSSAKRHLTTFFGFFLLLPAIAIAFALFSGHWHERLDYTNRNFDMAQRLLTEPSVLWSYVRDILIPFGAGLGLTHDDYPITQTLISMRPIAAISGWIVMLLIALRLHHAGYRLVLAGCLFFLAGHAMESTIFPLEIYFEHRNYLPGIGVLLAAFGLIAAGFDHVPSPSVLFRRSVLGLGVLIWGSYAAATAVRASTWQDMDTLMRSNIEGHPLSPRLNFQFAGLLLDEGLYEESLRYMSRAAELAPLDSSSLLLGKVSVYCQQGSAVPGSLIEYLRKNPPTRFNVAGDLAYESMTKLVIDDKCRGVKPIDAALLGQDWAKADTAVRGYASSWRFRHYIALNFSRSNEWEKALPHSEAAWKMSDQLQPGLLLLQLYEVLDKKHESAALLAALHARDDGSDIESHRAIEAFLQQHATNPGT